jgi:uncharacterized protein (DUF2267 family)
MTTYARFLSEVAAETGWSTDTAARFTQGVLVTLEERLPDDATQQLQAELPARLHRARPRARALPRMTYDEFLDRVASRIDEPLEEVDRIVRLVFRAFRAHLGTLPSHRVEAALSDELRRLWNRPSFGRR